MGDRGNVFAASKSSIGIRFRYRHKLCEERIKIPPTPRNMNYARNLRGRIMDEIAKGTFDYYAYFPESAKAVELAKEPAAMVTVAKKLSEWMEAYRPQLERSTEIGYDRAITTLSEAFSGVLLRDLTRDRIMTWLKGQPCSAKRLSNMLTPLRKMLYDAFEDGIIQADPMRGVKVKRRKKEAADGIDPFTPDEVSAIIGASQGQFRNLVQFGFWSGLRTSELIALKWEDVDFARGIVKVRRARVAGQIKGPKTKAGKRDVKLLPAALAALQAQREHTLLQREWVFHDPRTGKAWAGDKPIREWHWRPTLTAAGVRYRYPYQMRHTYASTLLSAGENVMWVAGQMGHRDWMMVARTYGRWMPDVAPDAGDKAAAVGFAKEAKA